MAAIFFSSKLCYHTRMTELVAEARVVLGRKVKNMRTKGRMPAVLYGEGVQTRSISITARDFERAYRQAGESTLVTLSVDGAPFNVLIHDVAYHPIKGNAIHADFFAVRMDKVIRAMVPINFIGESPAVKSLAGILIKVVHELEVEALPQNLPHELTADISALTDFEAKLTVGSIAAPDGVKILAHTEETIALVEPPRSDEELSLLKQAPVEEAIAEVKTEGEIKRAARESEKPSEEAEK